MTNPLINTIYFDMGWTLRHTVKDPIKQQYWLNKIIQMTGLSWTPAEMAAKFTERAQAYKKWGENSLVELHPEELWLKWLLPEFPEEFVLANAIEMNRYWRKAIGEGELYPHAAEVISELFHRGYRLGIISNTVSSEETPNLIKKYGIDRYFEVVILSCDFGKRKPDPSIFHAATEWMGVDPSTCAYVGDQIDRDICGSKHAGFSLAIQIEHAPRPKEGSRRSGRETGSYHPFLDVNYWISSPNDTRYHPIPSAQNTRRKKNRSGMCHFPQCGVSKTKSRCPICCPSSRASSWMELN